MKQIRALIVEDDDDDLETALSVLGKSRDPRFETVIARSLASAIEALGQQSFTLVVLDLGLPDSFGMETLRRVREAAPDIAILVLTGTDDQVVALEAIGAGAQEYVPKDDLEEPLLLRSARYAVERARTVTTASDRKTRERVLRRMKSLAPARARTEGIQFTGRYLRAIESFFESDAPAKDLIDELADELFLGRVSGTELIGAHLAALERIVEATPHDSPRSVDQGRVFLVGLLAGLADRYRGADPRDDLGESEE